MKADETFAFITHRFAPSESRVKPILPVVLVWQRGKPRREWQCRRRTVAAGKVAMLQVPEEVKIAFELRLNEAGIPTEQRGHYHKA